MDIKEAYDNVHHIHLQTHPHLRHIGNTQSTLIALQHPQSPHIQQHGQEHHIHQNQQQLPNQSQLLQQQHTKTIQKPPQQSNHHAIQSHLVQNLSHYSTHSNQQQNGETRPSVIESNQPLIIECT